MADSSAPAGWSSQRLEALMPSYWAAALTGGDRWPTAQEHAE